ncbi:hypothetical protein RvY_07466 [Ramazzottius varieornatus]|uniref:GRAM domain-containing protein n=1 Tax=Ramazzottius varieornatus TaxID=947166 RepID=A0A1D1V4W2_RAMVA|nr:hypothetical protein RvY_07466 [Ramazzottius varieornatus]
MLPKTVAKPTRVEKFRQRFLADVPENEELIEYYSCALHKDYYLQHGALYITKNFVCFRSTIFGQERKLIIPTCDILHVYKNNTLRLIPSGIVVDTGAHKYHFAAFGGGHGRHSAYMMLHNVAVNQVRPAILQNGFKDEQRFIKSQSSCTLSSPYKAETMAKKEDFLAPLSASVMHSYVDNIRRQSRSLMIPPAICITPPETPASFSSLSSEYCCDVPDCGSEDQTGYEPKFCGEPSSFQSSAPKTEDNFAISVPTWVPVFLGYLLCAVLACTAVFGFFREMKLFGNGVPSTTYIPPLCSRLPLKAPLSNETVQIMRSLEALENLVQRICHQVHDLKNSRAAC